MHKYCFCLLLLVSVSLNLKAQTSWYRVKLGDSISVAFPKMPGKGAGRSYGCKDSTGVVFAASVSEIAKAINFDIATFDSVVVEQDFANDFLEGFKPSMPNYSFGPVSISDLTGKVSYQIEGKSELDKSKVYFIAIFIDGTAYSFTCVLPDGKSVMTKNLFFKSIRIGKS